MRNNTQKIYDRLIKGEFITFDSTDAEVRHLFNDLEENFDEYSDYFRELGLKLDGGEGYYYFSRIQESKQNIDQKLQTFSKWIDIIDFLKTFDSTFSTGTQFSVSMIEQRISLDVDLRDKAKKLDRKRNNIREILEKLLQELTSRGYAEIINEQLDIYKVTSAFRYAEDLVNLITIYQEEDTPEE